MNPKQVRLKLRAFLEKHLRIDEWGLNFPANIEDPNRPPSIAREEALTDSITSSGFFPGQGGSSPVLGSMKLSFTVMFRFDAIYKYEDLPKKDAETLLLKMIVSLRTQPECLGEEFREIQANGNVVVVEAESKDWLLVYKISISPVFEVEMEDLTVSSTLMSPFSEIPSLMAQADENALYSQAFEAETSLEGFRVVALVNDLLVYADHQQVNLAYKTVGLLMAATAAGAMAAPLQEGVVTNSAWSWVEGQPIYLGSAGRLTQTPPLEGFLLPLGSALTSSSINFFIEEAEIYGA